MSPGWHSFTYSFVVNSGPLYEIICFGMPNLAKVALMYFTTLVLVMSGMVPTSKKCVEGDEVAFLMKRSVPTLVHSVNGISWQICGFGGFLFLTDSDFVCLDSENKRRKCCCSKTVLQ